MEGTAKEKIKKVKAKMKRSVLTPFIFAFALLPFSE